MCAYLLLCAAALRVVLLQERVEVAHGTHPRARTRTHEHARTNLQELVEADERLLQLEVLEAQPVLASLEHLAVTGFGRQVGSTVSERARKRRGLVC